MIPPRDTRRRDAGVALQDALIPQLVESNDKIEDAGVLALQDALNALGPVLIGLIAHLSDSTLQDGMPNSPCRLVTELALTSRFSAAD
jgi:hypothetical protein